MTRWRPATRSFRWTWGLEAKNCRKERWRKGYQRNTTKWYLRPSNGSQLPAEYTRDSWTNQMFSIKPIKAYSQWQDNSMRNGWLQVGQSWSWNSEKAPLISSSYHVITCLCTTWKLPGIIVAKMKKYMAQWMGPRKELVEMPEEQNTQYW